MRRVMSKVPNLGDIYPDGVTITVDWGAMEVDMSVFVPCINSEEAKLQAEKVAKKQGWRVKTQPRIEDGIFGVRIWRTL
jgi:hypothetical protein|tara:strand:- start:5982 stop:6218 length:237 start_codon:yes stop_codon:yes gene_type:complete